MQSQEAEKIAKFIVFASPIVTGLVETALKSFGWQVKQEGHGLKAVFHIKAKEKEMQLHLHNLLLEITTTDRDRQPLEFDNNLKDFNYFINKTTRLVQSKLKVVFLFMGEEDVEKAIANIRKEAGQYERIRIWRMDKK